MNKDLQKNILLGSILLILIGLGSYILYNQSLVNTDTSYYEANYIADIDNPNKLAGAADNIFVAKIIEIQTESYIDEYDMPHSFYTAEIIENIKGELSGKITVILQGGYEGKELVLPKDTDLLKTGNEYILATLGDKYKIISHPNAVTPIKTTNSDQLLENKRNDLIKEWTQYYKNEVYSEDGRQFSNMKNAYSNLSQSEKENIDIKLNELNNEIDSSI